MFDKNVYTKRQPSFWEEMRMNAIVGFVLAIIAPAAFGVAAAATEGNKQQMAAELREAKQNSFTFVKAFIIIVACIVGAIFLGIAVRLGLIIWIISMFAPGISH